MHFNTSILIALSGALGALLRYLLGCALPASDVITSTLVVNCLGSCLLCIVYNTLPALRIPNEIVSGIGTGAIGAFTTMSTFSKDVVLLIHTGNILLASETIVSSLLLCMLGAFLGWQISTLITKHLIKHNSQHESR